MFGHDDKPKDDERQEDGASLATDTDQVFKPEEPEDKAAADVGRDSSWQPPANDDSNDTPASEDDVSSNGSADTSASETSEGLAGPTPSPFKLNPGPTADGPHDNDSDDLIDIKQEALGKLSPLIGHLDQTPEEKFRTLMMMIQASDDQSLVRQAYETALKIDDEKTRAQALLDIVNEINYFTQNPAKSE